MISNVLLISQYQEGNIYLNKLTEKLMKTYKIYKMIFKIQQSCSVRKAELGARNMILLLVPDTVSRGSLTSGQNSVNYLGERLFQPETA